MLEAEEKYQAIFENTGTATIIIEEDMTISLVNREFENLSGYIKEEIEGKKLWPEFVLSSDLDKMKEYHHLRRNDPEAAPNRYDFRFIDRQGAIKNIIATVDIIPRTNRSVASFLDVTDRIKTEEALKASEARLKDLFENASDLIQLMDKEGKYLYVNKKWCGLLGFREDEAKQLRFTDIVRKDLIPHCNEMFRRVANGETIQQMETIYVSKDGREIEVEGNISPLHRNGQFVSCRGIFRDITERKILEAQMDSISMELSISLFEVFEALKKISSGDPDVRISEESEIEIVSKLRHMINLTAENIGEIVLQSHEFAMVLTELFDVFHRITKGDLNVRVSGESSIDLLNALRNVSNEMIESIERENTQRLNAEKILMDSEDYLKAIMATIQAGVMVIDVENHTIAEINEAAANLIGVKREDIIGKECHRYICPAEKGKCPIIDLNQIVDRSERVVRNAQGEKIPVLKTVVPLIIKGRKYLIESFIDITERKRMEKELKRVSVTDNLTQVYNRTKYEEVIKREIERTKRSSSPLSVAMFDIDHFKKVNDTHGHAVGDYVLKTLSQIAKGNIRDIDYLIRWGGEEFLLIALDTDLRGTEVLAEKIRKAIENYSFDKVGHITVSFGVTQFKQDDTEDSFMKRADDALYQAKEKGRNRVEVAV